MKAASGDFLLGCLAGTQLLAFHNWRLVLDCSFLTFVCLKQSTHCIVICHSEQLTDPAHTTDIPSLLRKSCCVLFYALTPVFVDGWTHLASWLCNIHNIQHCWTQKITQRDGLNKLRLVRPQTQQKELEHVYLQFLTTLTPAVETTVNLHGSSKFINQEI